MNPEEIRQSLASAFPDAQIRAEDSTGGGDHFAVHITSASFPAARWSSVTRWSIGRSDH
jgi:stress-induced morphogen